MVDNEDEVGGAAAAAKSNDGIRYVDMVGPMSDEKSFIDVPCSSKEVVQVKQRKIVC